MTVGTATNLRDTTIIVNSIEQQYGATLRRMRGRIFFRTWDPTHLSILARIHSLRLERGEIAYPVGPVGIR